MHTLEDFAAAKLERLASQDIRRRLKATHRLDGIRARRDGRELISFCCNDYLNLSHHPRIKRAAIEAVEVYGAGAGASRLVTGNHPLYAELEARLARLKGTEAACVFGSGYLANIGIIPALAGREDLVLLDALTHSSGHAGARLSGARILTFAHNDPDDLQRLLREQRTNHRHCIAFTEGVFSMDGDRAPLPELNEICAAYDCWLICDDAHGLGVLGGGRGSAFEWDPPVPVPLAMGTLSKAVGAYGGYLCASRPVVELMVSRARSMIYTTGLPASVIAAAIAALDIIENDAERTAAPLRKARLFTKAAGLPAAESCIVPLIVGDARQTLTLSLGLQNAGFLVTAIRPPTVPQGTSRLRMTFTAEHDDTDILHLAAWLRARNIGPAR